ncbi:MAG TPA: TIGR03618 family F420-dependent PPOX class oxidoreductase [Pseudomonadales bacterium]
MISEDRRADRFLSEHRWAVLTTLRSDGSPVSSVVAYAREGDSLLISTPGATFKRRSIERNPRVSLCVISNSEPFSFVNVEGRALVQTEHLLEGTRRIFANIAETGYPEPEDLARWLEDQSRVLIRVQPERIHAVLR